MLASLPYWDRSPRWWASRTFELLPIAKTTCQSAVEQGKLWRAEPDCSYGGMSHRIFASSLLMRFSSNSRALAFLKSAMNCTSPRMFELFELERPRNPAAVDDMLAVG